MVKGVATVGVYIGQNKLSVAQIKGTMRGPKVVRFGQANIDIKKKDKVAEAISKVLKEADIQAEEIFIALPSKETIVRFLDLPRVPKVEQETTIKFEAQKLIPFKPEDLVYDFELKERLATKKMESVFVAAKKETVKDYLDILGRTGLRIKTLEPASFSLMRALKSNGQIKKGKITAIIDINQDEGNINIIKDGFPCLTRDFSYASSQFVSDIEKKSLLQSLINELLSSFSYFKRQFPQDTVDEVLLCGEIDLKGWDGSLNKELGIPVELARPWEMAGEEFLPFSSGLSIAIGSALRGLIRSFPEVNLYESKEKPLLVKRKEELLRVASVSASVACLLLLAFYLTMANRVATMRNKLRTVKVQMKQSELVTDLMSRSDLETLKVNLAKKLSTFQRIINERSYLTTKFNELPRILPDGLWLTNVSSEEKMEEGDKKISRFFRLKGVAFLEDSAEEIGSINNFVSKLSESQVFSKDFREIKLDSITRDELKSTSVTLFEITCSTD